MQANSITREVTKSVFLFRVHSQKKQYLKFNENHIAQQRNLFCSVTNLNLSSKKNFVKSLRICEIQAFKVYCTAAVQR